MALDLRVVSLSPMLGREIKLKEKKKRKKKVVTRMCFILIRTVQAIGQPSGLRVNIFLLLSLLILTIAAESLLGTTMHAE